MARINKKPVIKVGIPEKSLPVPAPLVSDFVDVAEKFFGWLEERERTKQFKEIASVKKEEMSVRREEIKRKAEIYIAMVKADLEKSRMRHEEEMKKLEIEWKIKEKKLDIVREFLLSQIQVSSIPPEHLSYYFDFLINIFEEI